MFGLFLVLVFVSSYVYFVSIFVFTSAFVSFLTSIFLLWFQLVSIFFSCCFVYDSIIRFQHSVFKCVDFGLFRISLRLSSASRSEGRREKVAGLSSVPEHRAQGSWLYCRPGTLGRGNACRHR